MPLDYELSTTTLQFTGPRAEMLEKNYNHHLRLEANYPNNPNPSTTRRQWYDMNVYGPQNLDEVSVVRLSDSDKVAAIKETLSNLRANEKNINRRPVHTRSDVAEAINKQVFTLDIIERIIEDTYV